MNMLSKSVSQSVLNILSELYVHLHVHLYLEIDDFEKELKILEILQSADPKTFSQC